jgi:HK97 family phage portal protein
MIVQSFGTPTRVDGVRSASGLIPANTYRANTIWQIGGPSTYAAMYEQQPNVRTVIDFIARNVAQLGVHAYRRVSDTDRERLPSHQVIGWLSKPNPSTTQYRLIEALMKDLGIYYAAYWMKVRDTNGRLVGLVRVPPDRVIPVGLLLVEYFVWIGPDNRSWRVEPSDMVYFGNYSPSNAILGISPLETLRRTLAEECAAEEYRASFWGNSARLEGVIQRPATAPKWTPDQKQSFREQWQLKFSGPGNAGQTAVLEDGMEFKEVSYSAKDSEYVASRKLTREECARAYHIPLPMVGILDYATFSNIKEQHKQLYQDSLGPWLECLVDEFSRQLLPESTDTDRVYFEFNIAAKLAGSFEEQAGALQTLVGRPIMTANEGRARLNLPSMKDDESADKLSAPLNTTSGYGTPADAAAEPTVPAAATAAVIRASWNRQRKILESTTDPVHRAAAFDTERWDRELAADLMPVYLAAGYTNAAASRAALALAGRINADTRDRLMDYDNAFSADREARLYE